MEVTCQEFEKWKQVWGEVSPPVEPWLERQWSDLSSLQSRLNIFSTSWHCWTTFEAFTYNSPSHTDPGKKYQKSVFLLSLKTGYLYPKGILVHGQQVGIGDDLVGLTLPEVSVLAGELSMLSSSCYSVVIINYGHNHDQPHGLKTEVPSLIVIILSLLWWQSTWWWCEGQLQASEEPSPNTKVQTCSGTPCLSSHPTWSSNWLSK